MCVRAGRGCDSTAVRQTAQPAAPAGQEQLRQPAGAAACLWHGFNSFWPASRVRGASSGLKPTSCPRCTDTRGSAVGAGTRLGRAGAAFRVMGPGWCTTKRQAHPVRTSALCRAGKKQQLTRRTHAVLTVPLLYLCTHACKWADPPRVDSQLLDHNADLFLLLFLMVRDKLSSRNSSPRFWGFSSSTLLAPAQPEGFRKGLWNNAGNVSVWEGGGRF